MATASTQGIFHTQLDKLGASLSFACAIHCMLLPLVIGILPLIGLEFLADHDVEMIFVGCSILLAFASLCWGYRSHGKRHPFLILFLSAACIASGLTVLAATHHTLLVVLGATGITVTHLVNHRLCKSCRSCECNDH